METEERLVPITPCQCVTCRRRRAEGPRPSFVRRMFAVPDVEQTYEIEAGKIADAIEYLIASGGINRSTHL